MRPLGLSAFVRCKNEEEYIIASLTSCYRVFDEIIVVLNNSTDRTRELLQDLMTDHPKIRVLDYHADCAPAGHGYQDLVENSPERSLAKYYNWCLEQTTYSHVCKWDGDMIALPTFEAVREQIGIQNVISFDGYDVLGRNSTSCEARIFRYDPSHTKYEDWELYEILKHEYPSGYVLEEKCYLHMKLVKKEWLHSQWASPIESATTPEPGPGAGLTGESLSSRIVRWLRSVARHGMNGIRG